MYYSSNAWYAFRVGRAVHFPPWSMSKPLPSQKDIDKAIGRNEPLETVCKICERRVKINPYTLLAEATSSGYRWES